MGSPQWGSPDKDPGRREAGTSPLESLNLSRETPRILLVDDDPSFGKILAKIAQQSRVAVTVCHNLQEVGETTWWDYDVAIVDYDLGTSTGLEIIRQLERVRPDMPVILVSQSQHVETPISRWPGSIKGFMNKALGHFAIMESALAAHELAAMKAAGNIAAGGAVSHRDV